MENTFTEFSGALANAVEQAGKYTVAVDGRQRVPSSGVLWRPGIVAMADHTLKRHEEIYVHLPDGHRVAATLAGRDPGTDLAILKLAESGTMAAETAASHPPRVGEIALAVGRPGTDGLTVSMGVLSAVGGPWRTWRGGHIDSFLRPDVRIYVGFSGGPLIDADGRLIGINTSGLSRGTPMTVPTATVNRVVDELMARGHIARGYLGIGMHPVQLPDGRTGLILLSVEPGGPASVGGAFVGDVLVAIAGEAVTDTDDVQKHLSGDRIGKPLVVSVVRGGQAVELTMLPAEKAHGRR